MQNNEAEEQVAQQVQDIYDRVQRQVYWFLAATLLAITATSLYLIRSNRRLFAELASLSDERRDVAQTLIATREATLREISRELHDEFGQVLTAMGSMLGRAEQARRRTIRRCAPISARSAKSRRARSTTSAACRSRCTRRSSRSSGSRARSSGTSRRSNGSPASPCSYERTGEPVRVDAQTAIHVYRVLQEALANVARHSGATAGIGPAALATAIASSSRSKITAAGSTPHGSRRGLGLVAMRERAALLGGTLEVAGVPDGGTRVRLTVPASTPPDAVVMSAQDHRPAGRRSSPGAPRLSPAARRRPATRGRWRGGGRR